MLVLKGVHSLVSNSLVKSVISPFVPTCMYTELRLCINVHVYHVHL